MSTRGASAHAYLSEIKKSPALLIFVKFGKFSPLFEDEKYCQDDQQESHKVVPFEAFFEVHHGKDTEYHDSNDFLDDFELGG